jgi:glutaredoxin 3
MECEAAKSFFAKKGIKYAEKDIAVSARAKKELIRLTGFPAVPTLVIGREVIWGFDANRQHIEDLLV